MRTVHNCTEILLHILQTLHFRFKEASLHEAFGCRVLDTVIVLPRTIRTRLFSLLQSAEILLVVLSGLNHEDNNKKPEARNFISEALEYGYIIDSKEFCI